MISIISFSLSNLFLAPIIRNKNAVFYPTFNLCALYSGLGLYYILSNLKNPFPDLCIFF